MSLLDTEVTTEPPSFDRVLALVRRLCKPPVDVENLAAEIVADLWNAHVPVSYIVVRNRCYDELRRLRTEQKHLDIYSHLDRACALPLDDEQLAKLILATDFTGLERKVLYMTYVEGLSFLQISQINLYTVREISNAQYGAIEKLKESARRLYG